MVFSGNFQARGWEVPTMVPYEEAKPSYRSEVEKVIEGSPDAINIIAYPVDGNKQLVEAIEIGYQGKFLFCDGMKGEAVASGPASKYIEGSFGTAAGALEVAVAERFTADFNAKFEPSTVPYNREAYDATVLIALAIGRAGESFFDMSRAEQGQAIRDNLRAVANPPGEEVTYGELKKAFYLLKEGKEINYQGVSGPIVLDDSGDISVGAIEIWKILGGEVVTDRLVEVKVAG
jgi:ABC-type branched-subunit amino acid transport system substrate-binding protein